MALLYPRSAAANLEHAAGLGAAALGEVAHDDQDLRYGPEPSLPVRGGHAKGACGHTDTTAASRFGWDIQLLSATDVVATWLARSGLGGPG